MRRQPNGLTYTRSRIREMLLPNAASRAAYMAILSRRFRNLDQRQRCATIARPLRFSLHTLRSAAVDPPANGEYF